jgi:hypothetical protein
MAKLIVIHDSKGKVVALGEVHPGPTEGIGVGAVPGEGQFMFEMEKAGELESKSLSEIHKQFRVDVAGKRLVKAV